MFESNTKFLIVDDSMVVRNLLKKVLQESGYKNIVMAQNGVEGFRLVQELFEKKSPVDFIISDWNMNSLSGIDFLKSCRADVRFKEIPFVMVSAESEQSQIIEAVKNGVSEYIVKPFNVVTFRKKIENVYQKMSRKKEQKEKAA